MSTQFMNCSLSYTGRPFNVRQTGYILWEISTVSHKNGCPCSTPCWHAVLSMFPPCPRALQNQKATASHCSTAPRASSLPGQIIPPSTIARLPYFSVISPLRVTWRLRARCGSLLLLELLKFLVSTQRQAIGTSSNLSCDDGCGGPYMCGIGGSHLAYGV